MKQQKLRTTASRKMCLAVIAPRISIPGETTPIRHLWIFNTMPLISIFAIRGNVAVFLCGFLPLKNHDGAITEFICGVDGGQKIAAKRPDGQTDIKIPKSVSVH